MVNLGFTEGLDSLGFVSQSSAGKLFYPRDHHLIFVLSTLKLPFVFEPVPFLGY